MARGLLARIAVVALALAMVVIVVTPLPAIGRAPQKKKPFVGVSYGPSSPKSPDEDRYYSQLRAGSCTGFDSAPAIFKAAADICRAALDPASTVDWLSVAQAYQGSSNETNCLVRSVRAAVRGALVLHRQQPADQPGFAEQPVGPACTPTPTQVLLIAGADGKAPHLVVLGMHLFGATQVRINDQWFAATSDNASEGKECTRVDVASATRVKDGDVVKVKVKSNDYQTSSTFWMVGPAQPDAVFGDGSLYDADACLVFFDDTASVTGNQS